MIEVSFSNFVVESMNDVLRKTARRTNNNSDQSFGYRIRSALAPKPTLTLTAWHSLSTMIRCSAVSRRPHSTHFIKQLHEDSRVPFTVVPSTFSAYCLWARRQRIAPTSSCCSRMHARSHQTPLPPPPRENLCVSARGTSRPVRTCGALSRVSVCYVVGVWRMVGLGKWTARTCAQRFIKSLIAWGVDRVRCPSTAWLPDTDADRTYWLHIHKAFK